MANYVIVTVDVLGVDHTPHYTRYLGLNPDKSYNKDIIDKIRNKLK